MKQDFANAKYSTVALDKTHTFTSPLTEHSLQKVPKKKGRLACRQLTYLLTYSMVQSPSWEANWFAASQEILLILWNPMVHYRAHKRPPLGQPNPVPIPTSHLLETHPNIIHPSMRRSTHWPLSLRFPHQDPIPPSPHLSRYMPSSSYSSWFYPSHNIRWGVQII